MIFLAGLIALLVLLGVYGLIAQLFPVQTEQRTTDADRYSSEAAERMLRAAMHPEAFMFHVPGASQQIIQHRQQAWRQINQTGQDVVVPEAQNLSVTADAVLVEPQSTVITPVYFKDGEPTTFDEYEGQAHVVEYLRDAVYGMDHDELAIGPQLLLGLAGLGKTLLAKVVTNELRLQAEKRGHQPGRFLELFPADIDSVEALDDAIRRAAEVPGSVVFIDEIHDLEGKHARKLYLVLEENRYQFKGDDAPTKLPPLTYIGATTDYGALHNALKRRWVKHVLRPATAEQLLGYVKRRPFEITDESAQLIVDRTKFSGAPWEALELYRMSVVASKGRGSRVVEARDVERVFQHQGIDLYGLRWLDRQVIHALLTQPKYKAKANGEKEFVCYGASEHNVCTLAGIDKAEYREAVRPRLMARGFMLIRPYYGQSLTEKAVETYIYLKDKPLQG